MSAPAARPPCRDCGKDRPLMRDGRCPHCSETARLAGKPKDWLPSLNTIDDIPTLERYAMTATHEAPTMLPGPVNGWTGKFKACRGCGTRGKMEIEDGYCVECYPKEFGPLGLKMAEARRDARRPAAPPPSAEVAATREPTGETAPDADAPDLWEHPEYPACLNCRSTRRMHQGRGLCTACRPLSLQPGYDGYIAPKKGPGGRALPPEEAGGKLPAWYTAAATVPAAASPARDETSVAAVEATVARHMAQLPARPAVPPAPAPTPAPDGGDTAAPDFEEYTETGRHDQTLPAMTLRKDGLVTINRAAYDLLGRPERVVILFARAGGLLAFRAAGDVPHARKVGRDSKSTRASVHARSALQHFGGVGARIGHYEARRYGDAVGIALRFEG